MGGDWNRQDGESPRAHALFSSYLALGPGRSLPALARSGLASLSYLKKLSARWRWQERALGWQASLADSDDEELVAEARARQLRDAVTLQQLARAQLARWVAKNPEGTSRLIRSLTPHQVARFWQTGFLLENELLPPVRPPQEPEMDMDKQMREDKTDWDIQVEKADFAKELRQLLSILRKAGLRGERLEEMRAKLMRWLWLPEDADLKKIRHPLATRAEKKAIVRKEAKRGRA